jgi:multisubunit Na+/H+ antiporter MnhC subunit
MDVFSGIEILFFFLGVFTTLGIIGMIYLKRIRNAGGLSLVLTGVGLFLFIFNVAWSVSSILEHEHQAANMGLLFFGLPGILFLGMAWKKRHEKGKKGLPTA